METLQDMLLGLGCVYLSLSSRKLLTKVLVSNAPGSSLLWEWGIGPKTGMVAARSPRIPRGLEYHKDEHCVYWMVCEASLQAACTLGCALPRVECSLWEVQRMEHGPPIRMFRASHHCLPGSLLSQLCLLNINDPMSPESHYR